ncbi:2-keto-4-pentenoate hydratase [Streptomyces sp. TLI_053]|uniref:2-keto-4-pentenoate hydratase n=1 Tax=Streptomyces sp. TLI_053 TaxID=1855352 RepID=UPI00087C8C11|nr:fumarylacetoacetate hydrolase family protein [Streptomyces sp. TLI_053]SDT83429.1 2-keto-4-pentenoate hydratase [Streptomyces sp. TLI_053]
MQTSHRIPPWQVAEAQLLRGTPQGARAVRLTVRRPGTTLQEAYAVQEYAAALRIGAGDRVLGYKVGLTSAAMQEQFGIDEPDSGILLESAGLPSGGVVRCPDLAEPRIEAEFAFRLGADLFGDRIGVDEARAAVDGACLALEVIDSRYELEGITLVDSVADNAASAAFVLGEFSAVPGWDLRDEELSVQVDATGVATGAGREVLGDPLRSVVWLARRLAGRGSGLKAGDVVLAGAVHASVPLRPGLTVRACSPSLAPVGVHAV